MHLIDMERMILGNIKRYKDTDADAWALVEANVNLSVREIVTNTLIEMLIKTETITTLDRNSTGNPTYTLTSADFDVPVKVRYKEASGDEWDLDHVTAQNIRQKLDGNLDMMGRPQLYRIKGNTSGLVNIDFHPVTAYAGDTITVEYLPLLTDLANDDAENIITIKYPLAVIEIATGWSFINIVGDDVKGERWLARGRSKFNDIGSREQAHPDRVPEKLPPPMLVYRRKTRRTQ